MHHTLCDYLLDLFHNAVEAGADRIGLHIHESRDGSFLDLGIEDNGRGMDPAGVERALNPFFSDGSKHPGRKVGLGLAFVKQVLDETGGRLEIRSAKGLGTRVDCRFNLEHLDCPPLGDLPGTLVLAFSYPGSFELEVQRSRGDLHYCITRQELYQALGDFDSPDSLSLMHEFLESQEDFHGEINP